METKGSKSKTELNRKVKKNTKSSALRSLTRNKRKKGLPDIVEDIKVGLKLEGPLLYQMTIAQSIDHLYGGKSSSNDIFSKLFELTQLPIKVLAGKVFQVNPKTLNSYKAIGKELPMHVRELSIKLNELYLNGNRIFGSAGKFNEWLQKSSYGLGGMKPIELLNTITGIAMISDELVSIEFGSTA